ncbi:tyrosine-protein phosphatase [Caballeronia sp. BR00000012568055]|uniref:tyrosine-protein phosphatase n=1 Tax=Caballeronia sp. BR00000012568055 TaxID=2918761 RepID=UPI0023F93217|nr:tyrosine-protein phosphatase [Caballeronia sp. BR00000012568055]
MMSLSPSFSRRRFLRGTAGATLFSSGIGASLLTACGGGNDVPVALAEAPRLTSIENFRDMAGMGDAYPTAGGRRLRRGMFYRSGALTASDADLAALSRLSIRVVHDLRAVSEAALAPDRLPDGATRETHEIARIDTDTVTLSDATDARAWMIDRQRRMITDPAACREFGAVLTQLARKAGPQVVHGATGKDRTGWVAALVLAIADVPLDVIIQDYLATNVAAQAQISARVAAHASRFNVSQAAVMPLYQAQSAVIEAAFDEMQKRFGTLNEYLARGLGVAQDDVEMVRVKWVV